MWRCRAWAIWFELGSDGIRTRHVTIKLFALLIWKIAKLNNLMKESITDLKMLLKNVELHHPIEAFEAVLQLLRKKWRSPQTNDRIRKEPKVTITKMQSCTRPIRILEYHLNLLWQEFLLARASERRLQMFPVITSDLAFKEEACVI